MHAFKYVYMFIYVCVCVSQVSPCMYMYIGRKIDR